MLSAVLIPTQKVSSLEFWIPSVMCVSSFCFGPVSMGVCDIHDHIARAADALFHSSSLFGSRVLIAEQAVRRLILFDGGESAYRRIKAIVGIVIVALADFAKQHRSGSLLHREIVVHIPLNVNALTESQTNLSTGRNVIGTAVCRHRSRCSGSALCSAHRA